MDAASFVRRVFVTPGERRLRAGWRLLLALAVLAAGLGVAVATVAVLESLFAAAGVASVPRPFTGQLLASLYLTILLAGLARYVDRRTLPDLGVGGPDWWPNLAVGLLLGLVMTTVVFAVELAAGLLTIEGVLVSRPGMGFGSGLPVGLGLVLTLVLFVGVGVFEELLVRGYLLTNAAEGLNGLGPVGPRGAIGTAAVLTSALFGALHLGNPNATALSAFNIAVVGLFLAGAYVVTDDLGVPVGIHITWNFSLSSVYGFPVSGITTPATVLEVSQSGPPLVTGGRFGPEAGLVLSLALAVAVGLTWWWIRRTRGRVSIPVDVAVPDLRRGPERSDEPHRPSQSTDGGED